MSYSLYQKPYVSPTDLIGHMQSKGLIINDLSKAIDFLQNINYYRFKIYLTPFWEHTNTQYKQGSSFENGVELYRFDDHLRNILFSIIGRLEIKLRSRLDQIVTEKTSNPFWYLDNQLFTTNKIGQINGLRTQLATSFQNSRDEFSLHFQKNYFNNTNHAFKQLPPFWVIAELTTFGNILALYKAIDKNKFKGPGNTNHLDSLSHEFGAKNLKELNNWLDLVRDVRNRCAHHSRVWNCNYREPSRVSTLLSGQLQPAHANRLYLFVALLHIMDKKLNLGIDIKNPITILLNQYPIARSKISSAGFPQAWETDPFWH